MKKDRRRTLGYRDRILGQLRATAEFERRADGMPGPLNVQFKRGQTKREMELWLETVVKTYAAAIRGLFGRSDDLDEFQRKYEKALYGKACTSEKKREAFEFLRMWKCELTFENESATDLPESEKIRLLGPVIEALRILDVKFFAGLKEAAAALKNRIEGNNGKAGAIGLGDLRVDKWLLEYQAINGLVGTTTGLHTPSEINKQFVSRFCAISDRKLHEKLHELGIPHRNEPRGKASPNYDSSFLNLPPKRKKSGKF